VKKSERIDVGLKTLSERRLRMNLDQLFTDIDDFCHHVVPSQKSNRLPSEIKKRHRQKCLCESEIMSIVIAYQMSGYRTFKWFYLKHVMVFWQKAFPTLPSYNRFVELMSSCLEPLTAFMQSRCGKSEGIAFIDSTPLCVCDNLRIARHKTFAGVPGRSKSSTGWFYGFKLHFTVNDCGDILSFCLTRGNVDDRTTVLILAKNWFGKLLGDKGYISQKLTALLAQEYDVELITSIKKNMKSRVLAAFDKLILRKCSIIETINDQLKNVFNLEHSRHRSLTNFALNVVASLVAYSYQEKKPSLNIRRQDLFI